MGVTVAWSGEILMREKISIRHKGIGMRTMLQLVKRKRKVEEKTADSKCR